MRKFNRYLNGEILGEDGEKMEVDQIEDTFEVVK